MLTLPADLPRLEVEVNRNYSLPVIGYYREGWEALNFANLPAEIGPSEAAPVKSGSTD